MPCKWSRAAGNSFLKRGDALLLYNILFNSHFTCGNLLLRGQYALRLRSGRQKNLLSKIFSQLMDTLKEKFIAKASRCADMKALIKNMVEKN